MTNHGQARKIRLNISLKNCTVFLQVLKIGAVNPDVFFIDGHFLPYYGLNLLAKG